MNRVETVEQAPAVTAGEMCPRADAVQPKATIATDAANPVALSISQDATGVNSADRSAPPRKASPRRRNDTRVRNRPETTKDATICWLSVMGDTGLELAPGQFAQAQEPAFAGVGCSQML